jgi:hypothetical protein
LASYAPVRVEGKWVSEEFQRLFEAAAPGNPIRAGWDHVLGGDHARLDLAATQTVKFASLYAGRLTIGGGRVLSEAGDGVTLALYPGDTLTQARRLYEDGERVRGLLGLREAGWQLHPNFHFGFIEKGLCWTISALDAESYIAYWTERTRNLHPYPRDDWEAECLA